MPITGHSVSVTKTVKTSNDRCLDKIESLMQINAHCTAKDVLVLKKSALALKSK